MKKKVKTTPALQIILLIILLFSCGDTKSGRPWGISDETITNIVKARLGCDEMKVTVDNASTPQIVCDQLGNCDDYSDMVLSMAGFCHGRKIKGSCVFRIHRGKLGNYSGEMIGSPE